MVVSSEVNARMILVDTIVLTYLVYFNSCFRADFLGQDDPRRSC